MMSVLRMAAQCRSAPRAVLAALLLAFIIPAPPATADSFDLASDFSDTSNPNGPWAYREGVNPLPFAGDISSLLGSLVFQANKCFFEFFK